MIFTEDIILGKKYQYVLLIQATILAETNYSQYFMCSVHLITNKLAHFRAENISPLVLIIEIKVRASH